MTLVVYLTPSHESAGSPLLVEMGVRFYVPALGRFLQVNPIEGGVDSDNIWPH
jgi:hypothetical protein